MNNVDPFGLQTFESTDCSFQNSRSPPNEICNRANEMVQNFVFEIGGAARDTFALVYFGILSQAISIQSATARFVVALIRLAISPSSPTASTPGGGNTTQQISISGQISGSFSKFLSGLLALDRALSHSSPAVAQAAASITRRIIVKLVKKGVVGAYKYVVHVSQSPAGSFGFSSRTRSTRGHDSAPPPPPEEDEDPPEDEEED